MSDLETGYLEPSNITLIFSLNYPACRISYQLEQAIQICNWLGVYYLISYVYVVYI